MRMTVCCPNQPNSSAYCSAHQKDSYNVFDFRLSGVWGERMWGSCLIWTLQEISPSAHKLLEPSHPRLNILLIFSRAIFALTIWHFPKIERQTTARANGYERNVVGSAMSQYLAENHTTCARQQKTTQQSGRRESSSSVT